MDHLSNLSQYTPSLNITVSGSGRQDVIAEGSKQESSASSLQSLRPGDTIQGEIIGIDGSQIRLAISGNQVLDAYLEQNIEMSLGQKMLFTVRGNNEAQLALSPLFENMSKQETANTALKDANLPITETNLKMIASLMEEGMSIDKNMLSQVNRSLNAFPDTNMQMIVQLTKMQIPVTSDNMQQFQRYMQNQHQIMQGLGDFIDQIPNSLHQINAQGNASAANQFIGQIFTILTEEGSVLQAGAQETTENTGATSAQQTVVTTNASTLQQVNTTNVDIQQDANGNTSPSQMVTENTIHTLNADQGSAQVSQETFALPPEQMQQFVQQLKEQGVPETMLQDISQGKALPEEILKQLATAIAKESGQPELLESLMRSSAFKQLTQKVLEKQWLIKPEDVAQPENVNKLYERIDRQTQRLQDLLATNEQNATPLAKTVQNMQSNINFMNDLNHMFTYVQLPLKFSDNKAHGDLYVYTNKKSLAQKSGEVSALLHLDMDHLGQLDVHVLLQNGDKVSTKFYVQNEETLELLAKHIDELNEHLAKKGYQTNSNIALREKEKSVMQEMLDDQKQNVPIATYSFDVRA